MEVHIKTEPWKHAIVEDILSDELFEKVNQKSILLYEKLSNSPYHPKFGIGNRTRRSGDTEDEVHLELCEVVKKFFYEYYDKLDTGNRQKQEIQNDHIILEYQNRPPNEHLITDKPNIHTDTPFKIMSFVINLSDKGSGTTLYTQDREYHSQTEWKKNRALVFVRNTTEGKQTFHSIVNSVDELRRVLVVFVADPTSEKLKK